MLKKFKMKDGLSIAIHNQPEEMRLEEIAQIGSAPHDRIIAFVFTIDEMVTYLQNVRKLNMLTEQGYLFLFIRKRE